VAAHDDSDDDSDDESFHPADDDDDDGHDDPNINPDIAGVYDQAGYDAADNYNLDPDDQNHNQPTFDDDNNGHPPPQEPPHYPNVVHVPPAVQQPQMTGMHEDLDTEAEIMAKDDNQPAAMPILYADNNRDGFAGVYKVHHEDNDVDPVILPPSHHDQWCAVRTKSTQLQENLATTATCLQQSSSTG
jgi:hypothetical protein